jgi:hypothetical protein
MRHLSASDSHIKHQNILSILCTLPLICRAIIGDNWNFCDRKKEYFKNFKESVHLEKQRPLEQL